MESTALPQQALPEMSREERRVQRLQRRYDDALEMARKRWPAIAAAAGEHPFVEAAALARNQFEKRGILARLGFSNEQRAKSRYLRLVDLCFAFTRGFMGVNIPENGLMDDWRLSLLDARAVSAASIFYFLVRNRISVMITVVVACILTCLLMIAALLEAEEIWGALYALIVGSLFSVGILRCTCALGVEAAAEHFRMRVHALDQAINRLRVHWKAILAVFMIYIALGILGSIMDAIGSVAWQVIGFILSLIVCFMAPGWLDRWVEYNFEKRVGRTEVILGRVMVAVERRNNKSG